MKKIVPFLSSALMCAMCFADIVIDEGKEYVIPDSGEVTISEKLTGRGAVRYTGGGTLILTNGGNDFSGGLYIDAGVVRADAAGVLGSGTVTISGGAATLCLNASGATFSNPIVNTGDSKLNDAYPDMTIMALENATLTGGITSTAGNLCICNKNYTDLNRPVLTLDCAINAAGKKFYALPYAVMSCQGKVTAGSIEITTWFSCNGCLQLHSSENVIGEIDVGTARVRCMAKDVLGGAIVKFTFQNANNYTDRAQVLMGGFPQTVAYVDTNGGDTRTDLSAIPNSFYSSAATTLTITGATGSHRTYAWMRDAISLVIDGEDETFVQRFRGQAHPTTGSIFVSNGTFRVEDSSTFAHVPRLVVAKDGRAELAMTTVDAFAAVTDLQVDGTLSVGETSPQPFKQSAVALSIGADGVLEIPEGFELTVTSLTVDGVVKGGKTYRQADLPGHISGAGAIIVPGNVTEASWTGGVENRSLSNATNWGGSSPDLTGGTLVATFAEGGDYATVDSAVSLAGIKFKTPEGTTGFSLMKGSESASLSVGASGVTTLDADEDPAHAYVIWPTLTSKGVQTWSVSENATVTCDSGLGVAKDGFVTKVGKGKVEIKGTSVMDGGFQQDGGRLVLSGLITTSTGLDESSPVEGGSGTLTFHCTGSDADWPSLSLNGVTIEKPVWFTGRRIGSAYKDWGKLWCVGVSGTTNIFRGAVYSPSPVGYFFDGAGSTLIMEGGGTFDGGTYMNYNTTIIRGKPLSIPSGGGLKMDGGTLRLEVAGNSFDINQDRGTIEFAANDAIADNRNIVSGYQGTIDLGTTEQHPRSLKGESGATLTGMYPSYISVRMGGYWNGPITGGAGIRTRTEERFVISGGDKTSCGDLATTGGTLEIDSTARWLNGTNVTVSGTGVLKLGASERLGRKTVLHLGADADSWKIDIPAGCVQTVKHAFDADGNELPVGVYGKSGVAGVTETRYSAHFANDGVVNVKGGGMVLILR